MPRYVAFLRAINVGGRVVKMERLRQLFEELGFAKVETFIASGNVIFESRSQSAPALQKKIESYLHKFLGYEVATFLRTDAELAKIAVYRAFPLKREGAGLRGFPVGKTKPRRGHNLMEHQDRSMNSKFRARKSIGFAERASANPSSPGLGWRRFSECRRLSVTRRRSES